MQKIHQYSLKRGILNHHTLLKTIQEIIVQRIDRKKIQITMFKKNKKLI